MQEMADLSCLVCRLCKAAMALGLLSGWPPTSKRTARWLKKGTICHVAFAELIIGKAGKTQCWRSKDLERVIGQDANAAHLQVGGTDSDISP